MLTGSTLLKISFVQLMTQPMPHVMFKRTIDLLLSPALVQERWVCSLDCNYYLISGHLIIRRTPPISSTISLASPISDRFMDVTNLTPILRLAWKMLLQEMVSSGGTNGEQHTRVFHAWHSIISLFLVCLQSVCSFVTLIFLQQHPWTWSGSSVRGVWFFPICATACCPSQLVLCFVSGNGVSLVSLRMKIFIKSFVRI